MKIYQMGRKQRGLTLIELIIVIVILGILSAIVAETLFQGFKAFNTADPLTDVSWKAFDVIETIANDVHTIRSANDITTTTGTQFVFTNQSGSTVTYNVSGSTLTRNSQTLATGATLSLTYLDQNGAVATASAVRYVRISVTIANSSGISSTFTTTAGTRFAT